MAKPPKRPPIFVSQDAQTVDSPTVAAARSMEELLKIAEASLRSFLGETITPARLKEAHQVAHSAVLRFIQNGGQLDATFFTNDAAISAASSRLTAFTELHAELLGAAKATAAASEIHGLNSRKEGWFERVLLDQNKKLQSLLDFANKHPLGFSVEVSSTALTGHVSVDITTLFFLAHAFIHEINKLEELMKSKDGFLVELDVAPNIGMSRKQMKEALISLTGHWSHAALLEFVQTTLDAKYNDMSIDELERVYLEFKAEQMS